MLSFGRVIFDVWRLEEKLALYENGAAQGLAAVETTFSF